MAMARIPTGSAPHALSASGRGAAYAGFYAWGFYFEASGAGEPRPAR
ncbi:MAG: hypothetical protein R3263_03305 [Myxococcota bacterium]|nr:hypothetical protein [Myxococcota bacterium]